MGGWTRIWVVLTIVVGALSGWIYADNVQYAEKKANDDYQSGLDWPQTCQQLRSALQPSASDSFGQYLEKDCGPGSDVGKSPAAYAKQLADKRDETIASAKRKAAGAAISTVASVSGAVGALFLAVGWIRRGFHRKVQG
jgi:hypothetical protein